jgi:rhomboid protease GluP
MNKKDEIIMRLVHYFVTEEDYQPIIVNGVKNEIWLENLSAPYKVIRINSNYIHNNDQLKFDNFKIKNITKQIKKKTFSFNLKTLNILLDLNDDVILDNAKNIDNYKVNTLKDLRKDDGLASLFPKLKTMTLNNSDSFETMVNLTSDISLKNEKENEEYEKIFKPKRIVVNKILLLLNLIMFILEIIDSRVISYFILDPSLVKAGQYYRLITSLFLHGNIIHFLSNASALYVIGNQVETFLGKRKYLAIYLFSGLTGSLLSCIGTISSLGASGAIFGLLGSLLYFGYHYRLYFGSVIIKEILPVVIINLMIGFTFTSINNAAHIGGLIGGTLLTIVLGVNSKKDKASTINGIIMTVIYLGTLIYLVFLG